MDKQNHVALALWTVDCAEHVLLRFAKQYPEDQLPRKVIEAGRAWARGGMTVSEARVAAHAPHAAAHALKAAAQAADATDSAAPRRVKSHTLLETPPSFCPSSGSSISAKHSERRVG